MNTNSVANNELLETIYHKRLQHVVIGLLSTAPYYIGVLIAKKGHNRCEKRIQSPCSYNFTLRIGQILAGLRQHFKTKLHEPSDQAWAISLHQKKLNVVFQLYHTVHVVTAPIQHVELFKTSVSLVTESLLTSRRVGRRYGFCILYLQAFRAIPIIGLRDVLKLKASIPQIGENCISGFSFLSTNFVISLMSKSSTQLLFRSRNIDAISFLFLR